MTSTVPVEEESEPATPFLKCVGGKRQLLPEIRKHVPEKFGRYFEPFVGGGALFFDLAASGRLDRQAWLGDMNGDFMIAYDVVQNHVDWLVVELRRLEQNHSEEHYYAVRKEIPSTRLGRAARAIYLNKTCYNGLYRVNRAGQFNTPVGRYANPTVCDEPHLRAASRALLGADLFVADFQVVEGCAQSGDFVYFDCPYWPATATSSFTGYTKDGFTEHDQGRLRDTAAVLKRRGVRVLLSNADVPAVRKLYADGFEMRAVQAKRAINSKPGKRGVVGELLIW